MIGESLDCFSIKVTFPYKCNALQCKRIYALLTRTCLNAFVRCKEVYPHQKKKPLSFVISNANVLTQTIDFFGTRFFWLSFSTLRIVYIFIFCYSNDLHSTVIMNSLPFFHFWEIYFVFGRMVTATTRAAAAATTTTNSDANHSICGYFWTQIMTFHENIDAVWYQKHRAIH